MREIPDPGFAGDDGAAEPAVTSALSAYAAAPEAQHRATLAALQTSRVLVPVVAILGEVEYDANGLAHDKTSDMAAVLMTGRDGRKALLAFTGKDQMATWDPQARPVPVPLDKAAASALHDGADALLIDVAGPVLFVVQGDDLTALADGFTLAELAVGAWEWVKVEA